MKSAALVCILIALSAHVEVAKSLKGRTLLQGASADSSALAESMGGSATAVGDARSTGGSVSVDVTATSEASAEVKNAIATLILDAVSKVEAGGSASSVAEGTAIAIGEAIATAYAEVHASVVSNGEGNQGCAYGYASAEAAATAYAEAYVSAVAEASNESGYALGVSDAEAIAAATAEAFAEARSEVCVTGVGEAEAYQASLAQSLVRPYAEAVSKAVAVVDADGTAGASVEAGATSGVETEGAFAETDSGAFTFGDDAFADASGSASASTTQHPACQESEMRRCCRGIDSFFGLRENCFCGGRCRATLVVDENGVDVYQREDDGYKCVC